jgi:propanediol utilization protein
MPKKKTITAKEIIAGAKKRHLHFAGYDFTSSPEGTTIHRDKLDLKQEGDYGADPLGDGTFRMVPSGDIVSFEERNRRLKR